MTKVTGAYRVTLLEMGGVVPVGYFSDPEVAKKHIQDEKESMEKLLKSNLHAADSREPVMALQEFMSSLGMQGVNYILKTGDVRSSDIVLPNTPGIIKA